MALDRVAGIEASRVGDAEGRESATLRDAEVGVRIDERPTVKPSPIARPADVNANATVANAALEPTVRSAPTWSPSASATVWASTGRRFDRRPRVGDLERGAFVGAGAVLPRVTVGACAVVGTGLMVTGDLGRCRRR